MESNTNILANGTRVRLKKRKSEVVYLIKDYEMMLGDDIRYYIAPEKEPNKLPMKVERSNLIVIKEDKPQQPTVEPDLAVKAFDMLSWKAGLPSKTDNENLLQIVPLLLAVQYDKECGYGSSWKGKGEYRGIVSNIDRKYDRLDKMTSDEILGIRVPLADQERVLEQDYEGNISDVAESKVDAVADLANYCLLYLSWIKQNYPLVFKVWVDRNIPKYLHDKISFIQEH